MKEIEYEEDKKVISYDEAMGKLEKGRLPQDTLSALVDMKMDLGAVAGDVETDLGKEIRKYTDAINTLMASNSSTKPKVEKALTTISGLKEFLGKGKGENAYQTIVRVGEDTGNLSKENFDNGIKALSDFYGLGIDLNELNKTAVQDMKVEKVETVEDFRKLQSKPETFLNVKFKDYSTVTKMTSTLSVISSNLEDVANSKNAIRNDEDRQERENAALIAREINKFNEAVNILRRDKTSDNYDDDTIKEALDTVRGFKSFLTDGEGQTNYQKINELINNHPKLEKNVKKGTNAMTKGLSAIDQALNCGLDPKELGAAKARPKTVKKEEEKLENREENKLVFEKYDYALNWINAKKAEFKKNPASVKNNPNYPVNFIVEIMAARDISNARRGEVSTLKQGMMTQKDIDNRCALLMDHGQFSAFINNMKTDRKFLAKAEEAAMSSPGHGGKLDVMMKEYLANQPAGALINDSMLERYMPSALQRIDNLKKQAAVSLKAKNSNEVAMAAAEIILLRNAVKSERKDKSSLDKPYPVDDPQFNDKIRNLAADPDFKKMVSDPKLISDITSGHGGSMLDKMRADFLKKKVNNESLEQILFEGTIGGRLKKIKTEAKVLSERLEAAGNNPEEKSKVTEAAKKLTAEYLTLSSLSDKKGEKNTVNVPRKKVDAYVKDALHNRDFNKVFELDEGPAKKLYEIRNTSPMTFATEFKKDMTKAKAENKKFDASVFKAMGGEQKSDVKKVDNPNPTSHM